MSTPQLSIDIRQLRYFEAVAECLSFRRASERLHVAQPALTRQVRSLEDALGVRLLERSSQHVSLTPAGEVVLEHARSVLQGIEKLGEAATQADRGSLGTLRIGFISHAAHESLPKIVRSFLRTVQGVEVEFHKFLATQQYETLLSNEVDVALLRPLYSDARVRSQVISRSSFLVAIPKGHPLADKQEISMADLAAETFVTLPSQGGPSFHSEILGYCERAGYVPRRVKEAADLQALIATVGSGIALAIVPESVTNLQVYGVVYKPLSDLNTCAELVVAWRRGDNSKLVKAFIGCAIQELEDTHERGTAAPTMRTASGKCTVASGPSGMSPSRRA
ncbi:LysR substrate-binding domain-containing protein [Cupriavidus taiwanensis]|uniref:LysR substrate-binding domain-containing protein n=1 Tax=Cupriavidus taiwanensis TaxID=164546 RepID=UPI0039C04536